ncbi:MAG TPA: TRL-like family protein [Nitrospirota bacterium]|nr:TRL-like family protein [Nitrospirota bacterium]
MRPVISITVFILVSLLLTGCLYGQFTLPYDTDLDRTVLGAKVGKASTHSILGMFMWGDAGTAAAAREGGITTINHMDHESFNIILGIYHRETTIVYGD